MEWPRAGQTVTYDLWSLWLGLCEREQWEPGGKGQQDCHVVPLWDLMM